MNEIGISPWFNHFDISHVLMTASAYIFYRGALVILEERPTKGNSEPAASTGG
jgi:hypothetical protein